MSGLSIEELPPRSSDIQSSYPHLLLLYDFPPSNAWGGLILIGRLLADYPPDKITILTSSYAHKAYPENGRLHCDHITFPVTRPRRLFGFGEIVYWLNYLLLPLLVLTGIWVAKHRQVQVIMSVAHGYFFLAAGIVASLSSCPYVLVVHDDWVSRMQSKFGALKPVFRSLFTQALKGARHIYAVSCGMQEMLRREYGVGSELQMPGAEPFMVSGDDSGRATNRDRESIRIIYGGLFGAPVLDGLSILTELVKGETLRHYGIQSWELHLYVPAEWRPFLLKLGWEHHRIKSHDWVSEDEFRQALTMADILFLPFSFKKDLEFLTARSFPSKTADYLASGKPILIFSPPYSSIVGYAKEFGFAEIVTEPNLDALARGISHICSSSDYRETLRARALHTFERNHNILNQREEFHRLISRLGKETRQ